MLAALLAACSYQPFIGGDPERLRPAPIPDAPVGTEPGSPGAAAERGRVRTRDAESRTSSMPIRPRIDHYAIGPDGRTVVVYFWGGTPGLLRPPEGGRQHRSIRHHGPDRLRGHPPRRGRPCVHHGSAAEVHGRHPGRGHRRRCRPARRAGRRARSSRPTRRRWTSWPASRTRSRWRSPATTSAATARPSPSTSPAAFPSATAWPAPRSTPSERPWTVSISEGHIPGAEVCIEIALAKAFVFTLDTQLIRDGSLTG